MLAVSMILSLQSGAQVSVKSEQKEAKQSAKPALPQAKFENKAGERPGSTFFGETYMLVNL
jgi:hypothetical protein